MTDTQHRVGLLDVIDDVLKPPTSVASVFLDGEAWTESLRVKGELDKAEAAAKPDESLQPVEPPEVTRLKAELDQIQSRLRASELKFTFRQLGRLEAEALVAAHQEGNDDEDMPWNADTYPKALVTEACCGVSGVYTAPNISEDEVEGLWERLGQAQTDQLFRSAWTVQLEAPAPFTSAATGPTTNSGQSSTTASGTVSPTDGS